MSALRKELEALDALDMTHQQRHIVLNRSDARVGLSHADVQGTINHAIDVFLPSSRTVPISMNQGIPLLEEGAASTMTRALQQLVTRFVLPAAPAAQGPTRRPTSKGELMRLGDRMKQAVENQPASVTDPRPLSSPRGMDPLAHIKARAQEALFERLGGRVNDADLDEGELRRLAVVELKKVLAAEAIPLSAEEKDLIVDEVSADVLGYGPLQPFLLDPSVTEVMANGLDGIWIERAGKLALTDSAFSSEEQMRRVIDRIVASVGRRIDESQPMVDARLADGSRMNAIIPPLAVDGPMITIRKFSRGLYSTEASDRDRDGHRRVHGHARGVRQRQAEHPGERRHRHWQDHVPQRAVQLHPAR